MGAMASQITSLTIIYATVYSGAIQRKHQSSASLASVCARNSPVTGKFPAQMACNAENVYLWWRHHELTNDTKPLNLASTYKRFEMTKNDCLLTHLFVCVVLRFFFSFLVLTGVPVRIILQNLFDNLSIIYKRCSWEILPKIPKDRHWQLITDLYLPWNLAPET